MGKNVSHDQLRGLILLVAPTYGDIQRHRGTDPGRNPNENRVRETIIS